MRTTARSGDEVIPTRQSLLSRIKDWGDEESWRDFFETYWRLIYSFAVKLGLSDAEAMDVVQDTVLAVARNIPDFKYDPARGSFKSWLLKQAQWRVQDQLRKRRKAAERAPDDSRATDLLESLPDTSELDAEIVWDEEWQINLLQVAEERVKARVSPRQFQIYDLYLRKEWPVSQVMETLGVSRAQVYLAKHRVTGLIKKEAAKLCRRGL